MRHIISGVETPLFTTLMTEIAPTVSLELEANKGREGCRRACLYNIGIA